MARGRNFAGRPDGRRRLLAKRHSIRRSRNYRPQVAATSLMPRYCIRSDNFPAISYFLDYPCVPGRFSASFSFSRFVADARPPASQPASPRIVRLVPLIVRCWDAREFWNRGKKSARDYPCDSSERVSRGHANQRFPWILENCETSDVSENVGNIFFFWGRLDTQLDILKVGSISLETCRAVFRLNKKKRKK